MPALRLSRAGERRFTHAEPAVFTRRAGPEWARRSRSIPLLQRRTLNKKNCLSSFLRPLPPFLRRQTPACTVTTTNRASSSCPREEANGTVRVWCWWLLIHRARNRISLGSTRSSSMLRLLAPASSQTQTLKRRPSFSAESANQIARKGMEIDSIRSTASRIPTSASILPGIYRRSDRPGRTRPDWI